MNTQSKLEGSGIFKKEKSVLGFRQLNTFNKSGIAEIFSSPDYVKLYDEEIQEITLDLISIAEMVLSNFDYQSIDEVTAYSGLKIQSSDGEFLFDDNSEVDEQSISSSVSAGLANDAFNISNVCIPEINSAISNDSSNVITYYGYYPANGNKVASMPGYKKDQSYYDLDIPITDQPGVISYRIYLVSED